MWSNNIIANEEVGLRATIDYVPRGWENPFPMGLEPVSEGGYGYCQSNESIAVSYQMQIDEIFPIVV